MTEQYQAPTGAEHPITPPPELVKQWLNEWPHQPDPWVHQRLATQAARWGGDQELEACVEWVCLETTAFSPDLQAARRPKPPSLKEQALAELETLRGDLNAHGLGFDAPAIRRALEVLPE